MPTRLPEDLMISRTDLFKVNPFELAVEEESQYNTRWRPVPDYKVRELANSIIEYGQQQPVVVRRLYGTGNNAKYILVSGFTRAKAVRLINSDPDLWERARKKYKLSDGDIFPLSCTVSNYNDQDSYIRSVIENAHRNSTSPVDDAHNHERMREMGHKDADIARLLQVHPSNISHLKALLNLSDEHKLLVHNGDITLELGLRLATLPPEDRDEVLAVEAGHPKKNDVATRIKEKQRARGIKVSRSMREAKKAISSFVSDDVTYNDIRVRRVFENTLQYLNGEADDETYIKSIAGLFE